MPVPPIPADHHSVIPYLIVEGAPRLIEFLAQAFDGRETHRAAMPDGSILHAEVKVGDSHVMLADARDQWPPMPTAIYLYVPDTDVTYRQALAAGATSLMEPADQFFGDRNAGVRDPSGNLWWIATHIEDVSPAELVKRTAAIINERSAG